jgi:hypothetical protein
LHRCRRRPDCSSCDCLPCGFLPFDVFPVPGSHPSPEATNLRIRALSTFLTFSGLFFHPVPAGLVSCRSRPWGFTLQGRSPPAEPSILSDVAALLRLAWLTAAIPTTSVASGLGVPSVAVVILSRRRRFLRHAPLQGFAPCECPFLRADCLSLPGAATLLGFLLRGDFSSSAGDPPGVHPLSGFPSGAQAKPKVASQSFRPAAESA